MNGTRSILTIILLLSSLIGLPAWAENSDYTIGPKDILEITVFDEQNLSRTVEVGPNGEIRFPLLRVVNLGGMTIRQAEKTMEELLEKDFLVDPQVSITVKEYNSQKVYVLGAVKNPGYYALSGKTSVLDIISKAGGITGTGGKNLVLVKGSAKNRVPLEKLIEANQKGTSEIEDFTEGKYSPPEIIDGHRLFDKGDTSLNRELEGGDILYIPKVEQVFVLGQVKRPGGIPYSDGLTLLRAITLAGGITEMGRKKVLVKRIVDGKEQKFKVNVKAIIRDSNKDIPLEPDDVIVVPRRIL